MRTRLHVSWLLAAALVVACTLPVLPTEQAAQTARRYVATVWNLPAATIAASPLERPSLEVERLLTQMQNRVPALRPELDAGTIGLTADGFVAVRDRDVVPIDDRPRLRTLAGNENADRSALYRQLAVNNDQPQWQAPIRAVFAQRWLADAPPGWWLQDAAGNWQRK